MTTRDAAARLLTLVEDDNPAVVELATLVSLSVRIEPELLRAVRLVAAPQLHAAVEADLWFSPLVASRGPDGIAFSPQVTQLLRERLRDHVKREIVKRIWRKTQQLHRDLSPALALEERVAWYALTRRSASTEAIERELSRALVTLVDQQHAGVARWAARAWPRLPVEARATRTAWQLKEASRSHLGAYKIRADDEMPKQLGEVDLRAIVKDLPDVRLAVRRIDRIVELGRVQPEGAVAILAPDTDPRLVELRWTDPERGSRTELVQLRPGETQRVPVGTGPVQLRTARGVLYELAALRPALFEPTGPELLLNDLRVEMARGRVIILVGAGVSMGATGGAPLASWTGLLEDGVVRCEQLALRPLPNGWGDRIRWQIQSGDVEELLLAAEAVTGRLGGREHGEYRRWLRETVGQLRASNRDVLEALRDLGGILATTNYDGLLEEVTGLPAVTWQDQARAQAVLRGDEQAVLHLHGFWQEPKSVVLGVRSYERLLGDERAQTMQEIMAAVGTLLFVGFGAGLADPNFVALRSWMSRLFKSGEARHFRLAKDDEVAALQAEHSLDERVLVLGYGPVHADLAPFLRRISTTSVSAPPGAASPPLNLRPQKPGGLPPVWNLLLASNPDFTGRTAILDALHAGLTQNRGTVRPQMIAGTGGVGKTQLAVEYAYRHRADYDCIWWVRAETAASLHADYAALAPEVGLGTSPDQDAMVDAVRDWLERNARWLLIFDNVEDPSATIPLLPRAGEGQLIMTSQQEDDLEGRADLVPLDVLSEEEATQFLLSRTKQSDLAAARQLAAALGYLPLALEQAGAFIAETKVLTLARYLELFEQRSLELLNKGRPRGRYQRTVNTTWDLSLQRLQQDTPAAVELLNLLAFLGPHDLPWPLLTSHADQLPDSLARGARDELTVAEIVGAAQRYSLVKVTGDGLFVHRLLQAVIRQDLSLEAQREWAAAAIRLLAAAFPGNSWDVRTWQECQRLLPHAIAITGHTERLNIEADATSWLLDRTATYFQGRAQYSQAKVLFQRALAIAEVNLEPTDPTIAIRRGNLGTLLRELGDIDGARIQLERALAIDEAAYGPDHPNVASDRSNLGSVLRDLGDPNGARTQLERALAIDEAAYGPDHPEVARDRSNLGSVLRDLGDLNGARTLLERALAIDEAAYGPDHPNVASDRSNLGSVLRDLGDPNGARTQLERALAIDEAAYGPDHPEVARDRSNLGSVLRDLGDLNGARTQLERALAIDEAAFGPDHPTVRTLAANLAMLDNAEVGPAEADVTP